MSAKWVRAAVFFAAAIAGAQTLPPVSKTVGTTPPPACANTTSIQVVAPATIYYCYQVTNPSNTSLRYSLTDDILGPLATNRNVTGLATDTIFANMSIVGGANATIGTITNIANWTFSLYPSETASASATIIRGSTAVPTLSDLGFILLGVSLLALSLRFLSSRAS